jgi:ubiquinone/menaquinone biosynthesis C-methylase UbiE
MAQRQDDYVMGRSESETKRLMKMGDTFALPMRHLLEDAGVAPGMKVLEIGSGAGDVAMAAARVVGPSGQVVGVEMSPPIVETARERARAAGLENITFVVGDLRDELDLDPDFDALVGRFILTHFQEPARVLQSLLGYLKAGGIVAFTEAFPAQPPVAHPTCPLRQRVNDWIKQANIVQGRDPFLPLQQYWIFQDAGLPAPQMRSHAWITGPDTLDFEIAVRILRGHLPHLVKHGIVTEEEVDIETLTERLEQEKRENRAIVAEGTLVDAWARKP